MDNEFMENEFFENEEAEQTTPVAPAPEEQPAYIPVAPAPQKPKLNKKLLIPIIAGVAVVAVVLAIVLFAGGGGSYKTPLDLQMNALNAKTYDKYIDASTKASNGLLDDAMKDYYDILRKTEMLDYMEEFYEDKVDSYEDAYGKNYKFYYEVEDKDNLSKNDLKEAKEDLKNLADSLKHSIDEAKENDDDDWEDDAEDMGVSVAQAKKLLKAMESMYKALKSPKVSEGYALEVTIYVKGSELDEPEEYRSTTVNVYKVNGKWVSLDNLNLVF